MRRFEKLCKTLIFISMCQSAFAQINESDTLFLQHATALTGSLQTGNIEAVALRLKADVSLAPAPVWALKTQNSYR